MLIRASMPELRIESYWQHCCHRGMGADLRKGRWASAAAFSEAMLRAVEGCVASSGMSMDAPREMSSEAARRAPAAPAGAGRCAVRASHSTKKAFSRGSTCSRDTSV